jgi:IS5 family transposase
MECKIKEECLRGGERRKRVFQSDCARIREKVEEREYKKRFVVERSFGQGKKWHGLDRARYRGRWRVGIQALMIFFVMNIKIIASYAPQGPL